MMTASSRWDAAIAIVVARHSNKLLLHELQMETQCKLVRYRMLPMLSFTLPMKQCRE